MGMLRERAARRLETTPHIPPKKGICEPPVHLGGMRKEPPEETGPDIPKEGDMWGTAWVRIQGWANRRGSNRVGCGVRIRELHIDLRYFVIRVENQAV